MGHQLKHRTITANGVNLHIAEQGEGPLVILLHGFPETWYTWRHQLPALADAGYHAVAMDLRGCGESDAPEEIEEYTNFHIAGDVIGLMDALGEQTATVVGRLAAVWNVALLRPDRIRAVAGLSMPFSYRAPGAPDVRPTQMYKSVFGDRHFYVLYFQTPGVGEHELSRDVRRTLRMTLYSISGETPMKMPGTLPNTAGYLDELEDTGTLPAWLTEADLDFLTAQFERSGFRGELNYFRNVDRNWELNGAFAGAKVQQPALFIIGDRDINFALSAPAIAAMKDTIPNLRESVVLPGVGHWVNQERPAEVNAALIKFLGSL